MQKIRTLLKGPILTQSGYGNHTRQIFEALLCDPIFDIYVEPITWGSTPWLTEESELKNLILKGVEKRIIAKHQQQENFDLFIHVTIPNEFERLGSVNVGVTAGIETDRISHVWVQKCNEMDLIIVPSEHSKKSIVDTIVDVIDSRTNRKFSMKVEKNVRVCNEGINTEIFNPQTRCDKIEKIDFGSDFCFLHVGQWGNGGFKEDRKNIALLVRYFIETFTNRNDVALVLKINMSRNSVTDFNLVKQRLNQITSNFAQETLPPIHLLHGNFTQEEMAALYNHPQVKAFVTLSHGEGFCGLDYTKIITEHGLKRLDEVKIGDKVLTHNKRFMPVTQELSRNYSGKMYEIETYNGANKEKITLTGNHRIYVFKEDGSFEWVSAEKISKKDILCIPKPKYKQFSNIDKIDILNFISDENVKEINENLIGYCHSNNLFVPCKRYIDVNENFSKIIGYYLAEGSYAKSTIHFSLNANEEKTIANELISCFKNVFGLENHRIFINENKLDLTFNSKIVGLFLKSFCGDGAKSKFIHPNIFKFSRKNKMNIISSLILGDGYIKEKNNNSSIEISLSNEQILRSVRLLLLEEGIISNFDFFNKKGIIKEQWSYDSQIERLRITQIFSFNQLLGWINRNHDFVNISSHPEKNINKGRPKSWTTKDYCLFEIKSVNEIDYNGKVYNLSVKEDESYCTENFVVHNCLPLAEAAACELPILATNWSGHLDFLQHKKFSAIEYDMVEIPEATVWDNILIKGSRWAEVKEEDVKRRFLKMVNSYSKPQEWAKELGQYVRENFDIKVTNQHFTDVIKMTLTEGEEQQKISPLEHLQSFVDTPDNFNVIYTMPMSAGDVYISTAVIDGLLERIPENSKIYFATDPKYSDILEGNPNIHKVIPWNQTMMSVELLEEVFDLALTPNVATQFTFSNWVRRGQGRLLAEEFANHCQCELGDYFIKKDHSIVREHLSEDEFFVNYITFHPGSGKGQWEARKYTEWQEVISNLKTLYPSIKIVQVGGEDEPPYDGIHLDLRGKTNVHQLASIIENSKLHLSIDTLTMHLAAGNNTPIVALFGSSHAMSTGPWMKDKTNAKFYLLESQQKIGCNKACYKYQCTKNRDLPCINEIDPREVVAACGRILDKEANGIYERNPEFEYTPIYKTISGYTTTYNAKNYPFRESIKSMLGFCDEVVVVDGCSDDGTWEVLEEMAKEDDRLQLYQNPFDWEEPGIDGLQKAFARALCQNEFLWQQDCDEVVHEDDYEKIKSITKRFPSNADILHLPVIELWGNENEVTGRRHAWKWRMSRNKPEITHGINKHARLTDEKTGKVYAKEGISDGCEYIDAMTNEMLPHVGFWNERIDTARKYVAEDYARGMNEIFEIMPSVFHYSWFNLEQKIKQLKRGGVWDRLWSLLYQKESMERFPGVETEEDIKSLIEHLHEQGGEDSDQLKYKFKLNRSHPIIMKEWIGKNDNME